MTILGDYSVLQVFALAGYELLLFAGVFFLIGAADDIFVDIHYLWGRMRGRLRTPRVSRAALTGQPLAGIAAVVIPAWHEDAVIGATVRHALAVWPQAELRLYVGCYANDPATVQAVIGAAGGDPRLRVVIHDRGIM